MAARIRVKRLYDHRRAYSLADKKKISITHQHSKPTLERSAIRVPDFRKLALQFARNIRTESELGRCGCWPFDALFLDG